MLVKVAQKDTVELVTFLVTLFLPIIYLINQEIVSIVYPVLCISLNLVFLFLKKTTATFFKIMVLGMIAMTPFILEKFPFEQIAFIYSCILFLCAKIRKIDFEPLFSFDNSEDNMEL